MAPFPLSEYDREALLKLYEDGKRDARRIEAFLNLDHSVDKR